MKTKILAFLLGLLTVTAIAQSIQAPVQIITVNDDYPSLWKEVSRMEEQSLPQSALEKVNLVYQKALKEKNSQQLIKALIFQIKYESVIDKDRLPEKLSDIEKYTATDTDPVEQGVLYAVLAQLYSQYYQSKAWEISQRTAVSGYVPEDIREWSANLFIQRIIDYVHLSIQAKKELQATDALQYKELLLPGESSRSLRPTLYDLLTHQCIGLLSQLYMPSPRGGGFNQSMLDDDKYFLPANEFVRLPIENKPDNFAIQAIQLYKNLLTFRLSDNHPDALLMADLDRLEYVYNHMNNESRSAEYLKALERLEEQFGNQEICVEIMFRKANHLSQTAFQTFPSFSEEEDENDSWKTTQNEGLKQAYQICVDGIARFPEYKRIGILIDLKNLLSKPEANFKGERVVYPGKTLDLQISHRNIDTLTIEIYQIAAPVSIYETDWNMSGQYNQKGTLKERKLIFLKNLFPYTTSDTIIKIPVSELGCYEYVAYSNKKEDVVANHQFSVSRLAAIVKTYQGKYEFMVTDRLSGKPIEGAQIHIYSKEKNQNKKLSSLITDKNGLAVKDRIDRDELSSFNATLAKDSSLSLSHIPWPNSYQPGRESIKAISLFIDRNVYRPGQTVFFKGIAYDMGTKKQEVISNLLITVMLKDGNGKIINTKSLISSDSGSFSGKFVLPANGLNGRFSISTDQHMGHTSFQVEEYKRPTIDLRFLPVEGTFHLDDQVKVKGSAKTFSGVTIQDTWVKYRIVQRYHWLTRSLFGREFEVAVDSVKTDDQGQFNIDFPAKKQPQDKQRNDICYTYEIQASLTHSNGETQETSTFISIGDKSMILRVENLQKEMEKESLPQAIVSASNLNGQVIQCSGSYQIYSLQGNQTLEKTLKPSDWETGQLIDSGNFSSGDSLSLQALKKEKSGQYRIIIRAKDDQGRDVTENVDFVLYSKSDKQPPVVVYEWLLTPKTMCEVGESAEIIYGSSARNVYVLYELFKDGKKLETNRFELSNEVKKLTIPFKESYGNGIVATLTFIKDAKLFTKNIDITKKTTNKALKLNLDVFRDKLLPGQKEVWKISVKDSHKNPVSSEILAGMYDATLDKIYPGSWHFNPNYTIELWHPYIVEGVTFGSFTDYLTNDVPTTEAPEFYFDSFNWFGLNFYNPTLRSMTARGVDIADLQEHKAASETVTITGKAFVKKTALTGSIESIHASSANTADIPEKSEEGRVDQPVQVRQNFNETAFFFPHLQTNKDGETLISFTVPESNTTWKFQAIAHTQDLKYGQLVKEAISQKQLMVSPNMPRFIRHGDKTSISSTISNLSTETLSGTIGIEFFDPATEKPVFTAENAAKNFSVEAGKTATVSWTFDVPDTLDMVACKIVAKTATFSDGEQHLLPVLPNRMLITESLPLSISGKQNKQFILEKLANKPSTSLQNYRLTLEFASNPAWYAVQALPVLSSPSNENVVAWFASYYAHSLATSIASSTPKIKQMIDVWVKQGGTKETLLSHLEKNQELKAVLLEETPWVMEAQSESEQKQQLALLFDINRSNHLTATAISKIKDLQLSDGGWSWFKGMGSDVSITQWMLYGMGQLTLMQAFDVTDELKTMQTNALAFIDRKFKENFDNLKKYNKEWKSTTTISTSELEYLFVRSFYSEVPKGDTEEAAQFYTALAEKYWAKNTSLYGRAITAMIMQRNGNKTVAQAILQSLRQHASNKEELGMFWANNVPKTFMFQSATATHTFIMQAFEEVGSTQKEMDALKLWLLKQKQTQQWESTPATVNAIAVLLQSGSNWLANKGQVEITVGKEKIVTDKSEAGTGYVKQVFESTAITPEMAKVSVSKEDNGPAWGALYWQYFEDMDKITQAKTGLNVEKKLFVEKTSNSGQTLVPVTHTNPLKVGEKVIVRLTVRNDRDMEYVLLKDMRGSCFEPAEQISGTKWRERIIYYQTSKDASTNFYFHHLPKGTFVFEYPVYVSRNGEYSNGTTTIQCLYAPEFVSHTAGSRIRVED